MASKEQSTLSKILSELRRVPKIPLLIIIGVVVVAISANWIAPYSPIAGQLSHRLQLPFFLGGTTEHLLGADRLGRDILSRLMYGARVSLEVSLLAILVSGSIGTVLGLVAAYFGGWVDVIIMRFVDIALSMPLILMAILLAVVLGPSFLNVILVIGLLLWPRYARQIRGEGLVIKQQEYVALARVGGCSGATIMLRHMLPNVMPTLLVLISLQVGYVILLESSLSFLGVGIPPPTPSWGLMVSEERGLIATAWWASLTPGLAILLTVMSTNLLGDWLRDRLDPKLRQV